MGSGAQPRGDLPDGGHNNYTCVSVGTAHDASLPSQRHLYGGMFWVWLVGVPVILTAVASGIIARAFCCRRSVDAAGAQGPRAGSPLVLEHTLFRPSSSSPARHGPSTVAAPPAEVTSGSLSLVAVGVACLDVAFRVAGVTVSHSAWVHAGVDDAWYWFRPLLLTPNTFWQLVLVYVAVVTLVLAFLRWERRRVPLARTCCVVSLNPVLLAGASSTGPRVRRRQVAPGPASPSAHPQGVVALGAAPLHGVVPDQPDSARVPRTVDAPRGEGELRRLPWLVAGWWRGLASVLLLPLAYLLFAVFTCTHLSLHTTASSSGASTAPAVPAASGAPGTTGAAYFVNSECSGALGCYGFWHWTFMLIALVAVTTLLLAFAPLAHCTLLDGGCGVAHTLPITVPTRLALAYGAQVLAAHNVTGSLALAVSGNAVLLACAVLVAAPPGWLSQAAASASAAAALPSGSGSGGGVAGAAGPSSEAHSEGLTGHQTTVPTKPAPATAARPEGSPPGGVAGMTRGALLLAHVLSASAAGAAFVLHLAHSDGNDNATSRLAVSLVVLSLLVVVAVMLWAYVGPSSLAPPPWSWVCGFQLLARQPGGASAGAASVWARGVPPPLLRHLAHSEDTVDVESPRPPLQPEPTDTVQRVFFAQQLMDGADVVHPVAGASTDADVDDSPHFSMDSVVPLQRPVASSLRPGPGPGPWERSRGPWSGARDTGDPTACTPSPVRAPALDRPVVWGAVFGAGAGASLHLPSHQRTASPLVGGGRGSCEARGSAEVVTAADLHKDMQDGVRAASRAEVHATAVERFLAMHQQ